MTTSKLLAPNCVVSVDANQHRNGHAVEHFSERAFLPDELICDVPGSTFDYVFDALPTVKVDDDAQGPEAGGDAQAPARRPVRAVRGVSGDAAARHLADPRQGHQHLRVPVDVSSFPMHWTANVILSAMRTLLTGIVDGRRLLSAVHPFEDYAGLVRIFQNYRSTTGLKTVVDFREPTEITGTGEVRVSGIAEFTPPPIHLARSVAVLPEGCVMSHDRRPDLIHLRHRRSACLIPMPRQSCPVRHFRAW